MSKEKYAMILGPGGITAGFIAASANELLIRYPEIRNNLDIMVGTSAGAGNVIYYLSYGMNHPGKDIWMNRLSDKKFINYNGFLDLFKDKKIYDIDYLVDEIFKKHYPLNQENIRHNKIKYYLPVQRIKDEEVIYFTNQDINRKLSDKVEIKKIDDNIDYYEMIRATNSIPFLYDGQIKLGNEYFMDAALFEPFPIHLPGMEQCKLIFILSAREPSIFLEIFDFFFTIFFLLFIYPVRKRKLQIHKYTQYIKRPFVMRKLYKKISKLEEQGRAIIITPKRDRVSDITNNSDNKLKEAYLKGIEKVNTMDKEIREFIK
jgi:predicted patatin/cPLA2 family phospholipase